MRSVISSSEIFKFKCPKIVHKLVVALIDRITGLAHLQRFYDQNNLAGLDAETFCDAVVKLQNVPLTDTDDLVRKVPQSGPLLLVCNHPFGCIEGVALAGTLKKCRPDIKVLANTGLSMVNELHSIFIFINPLNPSDPSNAKGIRECQDHLKAGGALLIFPAGKVSYYRPELKRICDGAWNRLPGALVRSTHCSVLPLHIAGHNSRFFIAMGRVYYRFKLLLLFREFISHHDRPLALQVGQLLPSKLLLRCGSARDITGFLRAQSYALAPQYIKNWASDKAQDYAELIPPVDGKLIAAEVEQLPREQHLADYKHFRVYYARYDQTPHVVKEITRLREKVFRLYNEGSGQSADGDEFDKTYLHLFIYDATASQIIGAYRMGQSDVLLNTQGLSGLYLSRMFNFKNDFINRTEPCLEMGRSFIVPEHQRSFYGLFLLWRGIGEFVVRHPQYRTLYGTVSLSKLYQPLSVECITKLALKPCPNVSANVPFTPTDNPEVDEYILATSRHKDLLSLLVRAIEPDGKDIPILMKQYQKLSARFYCVGIDKHFNDTPGLLLSVDLPNAPLKPLKQYLADGVESYLEFNKGK